MQAVSRHAFRSFVWLLVCGALVWIAPTRVAAQAFPYPPGSTEPVRLTAPRIPPLPEAQWTDPHEVLVATYGPEVRVGNAFRTLLNVPELVEAVMPFTIYTMTSDSTLSARHRELLILRTAWLCQNAYVWADHAPVARTAGVTAKEMRRIAQGPDASGWDPFEATLLGLADELFRNSAVRDATWSALEERYDLYNMVDAVMTVNEVTLLSMLFNSMGVQPDDGATARFPADVPYRPRDPRSRAAAHRSPGRSDRRPRHSGRSHVRAAPESGRDPAGPVQLRQPRLAAHPPLPGVAHPAHRLELPGGVRVGQTCWQRRARP